MTTEERINNLVIIAHLMESEIINLTMTNHQVELPKNVSVFLQTLKIPLEIFKKAADDFLSGEQIDALDSSVETCEALINKAIESVRANKSKKFFKIINRFKV